MNVANEKSGELSVDFDDVRGARNHVGQLLAVPIARHPTRGSGDADGAEYLVFTGLYRCCDASEPLDFLLIVERVSALADRLEFVEEVIAVGDRLRGITRQSVAIDDLFDALLRIVSDLALC